MKDFTLEQLGLFITLLLGGCGGLLAVCFKSRCDRIECCGFKIHRKPLGVDENHEKENIKEIENIEENNENL